jgi:flagellin-like protein
MKKKKVDNRGVTPVIAVILMVAITVILASVVGTYTLSMANDIDDTPPTAAFSFDQEYGPYPPGAAGGGEPMNERYYRVNVIYEAGPPLSLDNINITMEAGPADWETGQALWFSPDTGGFNLPFRTQAERSSKTTIEPGDESGPLLAPYDPQNPKGYHASMKTVVTDNTVEHYPWGGTRIHNDVVNPWAHTQHRLATPGTTIRVVWTKGNQKEILAEHTV